jgi:hypothetical protein
LTDAGLYAVYLGGDPPAGRMGEDHEVVFVVGTDAKDVRRRALAKWGGETRPHVDMVQRLDHVDGFDVHLTALEPDDHEAG